MKQYHTFNEFNNLNSELERIYEMMGITYYQDILNESTVDPRKIMPALEKVMESFGFTRVELGIETGIGRLLDKYETSILNSGKDALINDLKVISEKLGSNKPRIVRQGEQALQQILIRNKHNYDMLLDLLKAADPAKYELKAKEVVDKELSGLSAENIKNLKKLAKRDKAKFIEQCRNANIIPPGFEKYFEDYNPLAKGAKSTEKKGLTKVVGQVGDAIKKSKVGDEYIKGFKTGQGGMLFLKKMRKWITWPIGISHKFTRLTPAENKKVWSWFTTGVGDWSEIVRIFKNYGILENLYLIPANIAGQLTRKWVFWSGVFTATNMLIGIFQDLDEEVYHSDAEAILDRFVRSLETANLHWMVPANIVYEQVFIPLWKGGVLKHLKDKYIEKLNRLKGKAEQNIKDAENKVENSKTGQAVEKVVDKITGKSDIVPGSYESFEEFCKNQDPPLVPDVEDKENIGIYSVNGIEYTWNAAEKTFKK